MFATGSGFRALPASFALSCFLLQGPYKRISLLRAASSAALRCCRFRPLRCRFRYLRTLLRALFHTYKGLNRNRLPPLRFHCVRLSASFLLRYFAAASCAASGFLRGCACRFPAVCFNAAFRCCFSARPLSLPRFPLCRCFPSASGLRFARFPACFLPSDLSVFVLCGFRFNL